MSRETSVPRDLPFHEFSAIFPMMIGEEFDSLLESICQNGQQEPIAVLNGEILDGRSRYRACLLAGVEPRFTEIVTDDPLAYIKAANLIRRHLTASQRAMCAAQLQHLFEKAAKDRQREGARKGGILSGRGRRNAGRGGEAETARTKRRKEPSSRDRAGEVLHVSGRSVTYAARVLKTGTPALIESVVSGKMSVSAAARLAALPPQQQEQSLLAHAATGRRLAPGQPIALKKKMSTQAVLVLVEMAVCELAALVDKPAMQVSIRLVKDKVHELKELLAITPKESV